MNCLEEFRRQGKLDFDSTALESILLQTWHSRIWTVQEAVFAQECVVACGHKSLSWDSYTKAISFLMFENSITEANHDLQKSLVALDMRDTLRSLIQAPSRTASASESKEEIDTDDRVVSILSCLTDLNQIQATDSTLR